MSVTAQFDWPPKALSPNARCHWAKKAKAVKGYRKDCHILALMQKLAVDWEGDIHLHMAFSPPDNRRRDDDNMLASCKALRDGLADALEIDDSRFRLHSAVLPSRKGGAVVVALSRGV
ncbi:MAG: hypothetical protein NUV63_12150 [Gallionella sp.]|nr:hypothetical protein [Gallionella sp.]